MEYTRNKPTDYIRTPIRSMSSYVPGIQPVDPAVIKLNTNENPFPPTESVKKAIITEITSDRLHKYPDPNADALRNALAAKTGAKPEQILIGNGSDEILSMVFRAVVDKGDSVIYSRPTYSLYPVLTSMMGGEIIEVEVNADWTQDFEGMLRFASGVTPMGFFTPSAKLAVIANPNAPTGIAESRDSILNFAFQNTGLTLIDEAYVEFGAESVASVAGSDRFPRLMVTGTFSKSHSLAGQRVGWLVAHPDVITEINKIKDSYNVSRLGQAAALAALQNESEIKANLKTIVDNREYLKEKLKAMGFTVLNSATNFLFVKPPHPQHKASHIAQEYYNFLEKNNVLIRYFRGNIRIEEFVRITVGTRPQIDRLLELTAAFLKQ